MGKPDSGCPGSECHSCSPSISISVESIPEIFGAGLIQHWKEIFLCQKVLPTPRNAPMGPKGVSRRAKNGQKVLVKFDINLLKNRNRAKKHTHGFRKTF
jgi:hypothetical protein